MFNTQDMDDIRYLMVRREDGRGRHESNGSTTALIYRKGTKKAQSVYPR